MQLRHALSVTAMLVLLTASPAVLAEGLVQPVEIDFLTEYYNQDGDHSAVEGGEGTQKLYDVAPNIRILIPMGDKAFTGSFGFDLYSSASTDRIDYVKSSASSSDVRGHGEIGYTTYDPHRTVNYGVSFGLSREFDYSSVIFGGHFALLSQDQNREFSVTGKVFLDDLTLIYPIELRSYSATGEGYSYSTTPRRTYTSTLTYNQVLSTRAQASLSVDLVQQNGYLGTPFHRVYFAGERLPKVEKLPDTRFKYPVSLRLHYYLNQYIVLRLQGRMYQDDFGINASSYSVETPLRLSQAFAVIPFYRYHDQTAADYFAPYGEHQVGEEFYTSDYDLSAFTSQKFGLGFRYYPIQPIGEMELSGLGSSLYFKRIDLRSSLYQRSDGLRAFNVSIGLSFFVQ